MGHGSQCGRQLVHSRGVRSEIPMATPDALKAGATRVGDRRKTIQHSKPINIIERPIMLRMSTRNKSLHGAQPQAITNSCRRNKRPTPKISAPRRIVVHAIFPGGVSFWRILSVTSAKEIPARKRNSGAGKVPPNCDHIKKVLLRALPLSQES